MEYYKPNYDLISKYQNNYGYVVYNCDTNQILGQHDFYNFYYVASVMKPIVLLIYCDKYKKIIKDDELKKILDESNNYYYLKYSRYVYKEDEDKFFKKYYGKINDFSINITNTELLKDVNLDESYQNFLKFSPEEKKKFLKFEIDSYFLNEIPKNFLNNVSKDFYYMYFFKKTINFYHFKYGNINYLEDYPKCCPYLMLKLYDDLLHKSKFEYCMNFKQYMKNIKTSYLTNFGLGLDFYHKTGNHLFFRNEVLYFEYEKQNYILSFMSRPTINFKYGISETYKTKIIASLMNLYIVKKEVIHTSLNSSVTLKYFSSTKKYNLNKFNFKGEIIYPLPNSNLKLIYNKGLIEKHNKKIKLTIENKVSYHDHLTVLANDIIEILAPLRKGSNETHLIKGELNIFIDNNKINFYIKIPLIDYLLGVVYHESISSWIKTKNTNYIKSFSIVTKNYLITQVMNNRLVLNNAVFQIYKFYDNKKIRQIVNSTIHQYLTDKDQKLVKTFYSSSCGGNTKSYDKIIGIEDNYNYRVFKFLKKNKINCEISPYNEWTTYVPLSKLDFKDKLISIKIEYQNKFVKNIIFNFKNINSIILSHKTFKKIIKGYKIRSHKYQINLVNNQYIKIDGIGLGHHLGLCVWGSKNLSDKGLSYDRIIDFYFKNCEIGNLKLF